MNSASSDKKQGEQCIPFSNGTEAMDWVDYNCDSCANNPYQCGGNCPVEENVALGFATGTINKSTAEFIGYTRYTKQENGLNFVDLKSKCQKFFPKGSDGENHNPIPDPVPANQLCLPFELNEIQPEVEPKTTPCTFSSVSESEQQLQPSSR